MRDHATGVGKPLHMVKDNAQQKVTCHTCGKIGQYNKVCKSVYVIETER